MSVTLAKSDGLNPLDNITRMSVGVSWDPSSQNSGGILGWAKKKKGVDLDLIAVLMSGDDPLRLAGLDSLDPLQNGAVTHTGDNQTGHGAGDDEAVIVDFNGVNNAPIDKIVFVATAFKRGTSLSQARNVSFKVYDGSDGRFDQVADIWPSLLGNHNANAVAKVVKVNGKWFLEVLNETGNIRQGDDQSLLRFAIGK